MILVRNIHFSSYQAKVILFSPIEVYVYVYVHMRTDMNMCFQWWPLCLKITISSLCGLLRHILAFPMRGRWLGATVGSVLSGLDQQPSSHDTWPRVHPVVGLQRYAVKGQDLLVSHLQTWLGGRRGLNLGATDTTCWGFSVFFLMCGSFDWHLNHLYVCGRDYSSTVEVCLLAILVFIWLPPLLVRRNTAVDGSAEKFLFFPHDVV